ncbi:MAG: gamma-butyrobetaine hydroxylase-like domain-containing protein [Phycisphaeraceae bacterium]
MTITPVHLDLKRDEALTVRWSDGRVSVYPVSYLRRMSPSADAIETRERLAQNPLTVLPASGAAGPLRAERIEPVGRYAVRIVFSDGHHTGLYTWAYLREIDPGSAADASS